MEFLNGKYNSKHLTACILAEEYLTKKCKNEGLKRKNVKDFKVIEEKPHDLGTLYVVQYKVTGRHRATTSMNIVFAY